MADDIQLKRSSVPGLAPAASELLDGELALNSHDGKLYAKNSVGGVLLLNPEAPLTNVVPGSPNVSVATAGGIATVSVTTAQADWQESDSTSVQFIANKPTLLSQFSNDVGYATVAQASAAAPIQGIIGSNAASITSVGGLYTVDVPVQAQADWAASDELQRSFIRNKPTSLSQFANDTGYVTSSQAASAAPVQNIVGGQNVSITQVGGTYTVSSSTEGTVTGVSAASPLTASEAGGAVTIGVLGATGSREGVVRFATQQEVSAAAAGVAIDAAQLANAIPTSLSNLTNDLGFATQADIVSAASLLLPLSGGTVTGNLSVQGAVSAPTPLVGDSSSSVATTEWVSRELALRGRSSEVWAYGGSDTSVNPGSGFLRLSADGAFLAISKYAVDGAVDSLAFLTSGATLALAEQSQETVSIFDAVVTSESGDPITTELGRPIIAE